jgi:hypothetical protein
MQFYSKFTLFGTITVDDTRFLNLPIVGSISSGFKMCTSSLKITFFRFFLTPGIICDKLVSLILTICAIRLL